MHILLIHQAFATLNEPGGTRHHEFAQHLTASGHRVTIIASPVSYLTGKSDQESIPRMERSVDVYGLTLLQAYTYPALHRSFVHRVISFLSFMVSSFFIGLKVRNVDLVWGTSPPIFQGLTAWVLARLKRVPYLFEVRDLWPAFAIAVGILQNRLLIQASEWLERFLYHRADQMIVNSPGFLSHVQDRGADHVELIPNGADVSMFDPQSTGEDFRKRNGFENKFVALYAGAHGMSNDLGVVLEAAELLRDRDNILLVLLGDGKEKPVLLARAQELGLSNLKFLPPIPKIDMPAALAAANACIAILKPIPLYSTVYPNKVFDYMAAGRPVVLAMEGVIREVVEEARAGIAIAPGNPRALANAILTLADKPHESTAMGRRGHSYVKSHFDRSIQAQKLTNLIERLAIR